MTLNTLCKDSKSIHEMFTLMMLLLRIVLLPEPLIIVLVATANSGCQLLTNKSGDTNT
jgi:hypothetical protein